MSENVTLEVVSATEGEYGRDYTYIVRKGEPAWQIGAISSDAHKHGRSVTAWIGAGDGMYRAGVRLSVEQALDLILGEEAAREAVQA